MAARKSTTRSSKQNQRQGDTSTMATTREDPMLREHKKTYSGFMKLLGYSTLAVVIVLVLMAIFLV